VRAAGLDNLLGMARQEPMPQLMANGEILEAFVAVLGGVDDGGRITGEDDRADTPVTSAGFAWMTISLALAISRGLTGN
jgi:hypothetical protein